MCGLIGVINSVSVVNKSVCDFMRQGLVTSQLRGTDSTGLFQIGSNVKHVWLYKDAVNSTVFVDDPKAEVLIRDVDTSRISVAHVRAKTQGAVNKDNAHPFTVFRGHDRVIGAHNGSLFNWKNKEAGGKFEVDSNWALNHIANKGLDAFKDIEGAYCFVWWDEEDPKVLKIARNSQRPMHLMFSKDGKRMVFASEAGMVAWIAGRANFDGDGVVREVPTGKVWSFDTGGNIITWTSEDTPAPKYGSGSGWDLTGYGNNNRSSSYVPYTRPSTGTGKDGDYLYEPRAYVAIREAFIKFKEDGTTPPPGGGGYYRNSSDLDTTYPGWNNDWGDYSNDDTAGILGGCCSTGLVTTDLSSIADFRIPDYMLTPPSKYLVEVDEHERAKAAGIYGGVLTVESVLYSNGVLYSQLVIGTEELDVVRRGVGGKEGAKMAQNSKSHDVVVVGIEEDGTIISTNLTRRMRKLMAA